MENTKGRCQLLAGSQTDRQTDSSTACDGSKDILKYSCRKGTSLSFWLYKFLAGPVQWFCVTEFHVFVKDCHVLCHGLSCFASLTVISCFIDYHFLCHELSCFASLTVISCVTDCHFCVTYYLLGFNLCSMAVCINASVEHISSIFMVKYVPL